jgi:hypothetical protein
MRDSVTHAGFFLREAAYLHGEKGNAYRILVVSQKERDHYEEIDVGERIILE